MGKLVLLKHLSLDQGLHGVNLAIGLLLDELDFTERSLADNLDGVVVFGLILSS